MKKRISFSCIIIISLTAMDPHKVAFVWDFYGVLVQQNAKDRLKTILSIMKQKPMTGLALCNPHLARDIKKNIHSMSSDALAYQASLKYWRLKGATDEIKELINNRQLNHELIEIIRILKALGYKNYIATTMRTRSLELLTDTHPTLHNHFENAFVTFELSDPEHKEICKPERRYYQRVRKGIQEDVPELETIYCFEKDPANVSAANKRTLFHALKFKSNLHVKAWLFDQLSSRALKSLQSAEPSE